MSESQGSVILEEFFKNILKDADLGALATENLGTLQTAKTKLDLMRIAMQAACEFEKDHAVTITSALEHISTLESSSTAQNTLVLTEEDANDLLKAISSAHRFVKGFLSKDEIAHKSLVTALGCERKAVDNEFSTLKNTFGDVGGQMDIAIMTAAVYQSAKRENSACTTSIRSDQEEADENT